MGRPPLPPGAAVAVIPQWVAEVTVGRLLRMAVDMARAAAELLPQTKRGTVLVDI